jgi:hypothetical protein
VVSQEMAAEADMVFPEWKADKGEPIKTGDWLEQEPCVPEVRLAEIERQTGRPCPRVSLPATLGPTAELAFLMLGESANVAALLMSRPEKKRRKLYDRASAVLADGRVRRVLEARREAMKGGG